MPSRDENENQLAGTVWILRRWLTRARDVVMKPFRTVAGCRTPTPSSPLSPPGTLRWRPSSRTLGAYPWTPGAGLWMYPR